MIRLATTPASSAALLLNVEGLATMGIAWLVFRENVDRRLGATVAAQAAEGASQQHGSAVRFASTNGGDRFGPAAIAAADVQFPPALEESTGRQRGNRIMTTPHHVNGRISAQVREAIRNSTESLQVLAKRYAINPKTVARWKKRPSADDLRSGPKSPHSKLTAEEEDIIVRFREHTLLPLDDCLYALQAQIPHLSRSSLHRCLQRHGISRLGEVQAPNPAPASAAAPPGWLHIDMSEVRSADGVHYLFNAIDQTSKFVFVRMGGNDGATDAADFLANLAARSPFRINQVFTLDAEPFATKGEESAFTQTCRAYGIEHRLTSSAHPWTRSRGARMGRLIENSVTFASAAYLVDLLQKFVHAYNFRRRLKTLGGRTPYEFICQTATRRPALFLRDPHHEMVGLEIIPS